MSYSNPVSPKVTVSTVAAAITVLVLYGLSRIQAVGDLPEGVQLAVGTLILAAVTFGAGYQKNDPDRF